MIINVANPGLSIILWKTAMKPGFIVLGLVAALALPGCKSIKNAPDGEAAAVIPEGEAGDDARIAALLDKTYEAELLPLIAKALPVADLRTAVAGGLEAAGAAHGNKGSGEGAAWNFAVKGEGKVVEANLHELIATAEAIGQAFDAAQAG